MALGPSCNIFTSRTCWSTASCFASSVIIVLSSFKVAMSAPRRPLVRTDFALPSRLGQQALSNDGRQKCQFPLDSVDAIARERDDPVDKETFQGSDRDQLSSKVLHEFREDCPVLAWEYGSPVKGVRASWH
jgi:hypothetical protein